MPQQPLPEPPSAPNKASPFIEQVEIKSQRERHRRVERLILAGWILIVVKSVVVWWACARYDVPFNALWVIAPTVAFAALGTGVYFYGRR
jgi:hypothetical protein